MARSQRRSVAVAGALVAGLLLAMPTASAAAGPSVQAELAGARQYTAAVHTTAAAAAAGWVDTRLPCFDNPGSGGDNGGMGVHWIRPGDALTSSPVASRPNILVFDPVTDQLVAVEYVVLQSAVPGAPALYGHRFGTDVLPDGSAIYELHAYVWRPNPNGMFAEYNPRVHLCP